MYLMQDIQGETKPLKRFVPDITGDGICIRKLMTIRSCERCQRNNDICDLTLEKGPYGAIIVF